VASFKNSNPGCCCAPPWIEVRVRGCGGLWLAGATVELRKDGDLIATGTSDAYGRVLFDDLAAGTYSITVSKSPRFSPQLTSATIPSDGGVVTHVTLYPSAGYVCCGACPDPYPEVLYFRSAGAGTVTLTWDTESGIPRWIGEHDYERSAVRVTYDPYLPGCVVDDATCDVTVGYEVRCPYDAGLGPSWLVYAYTPVRLTIVDDVIVPRFVCADSDWLADCFSDCISKQAGGGTVERIEADCAVPVSFAGELPATYGGGTYDGPIDGHCSLLEDMSIDTLTLFFGGPFTVSET